MTSYSGGVRVRKPIYGSHGGIESGRTYGDYMRFKNNSIIHNEIRLLTGTSNPALAEEVANLLKIGLEKPITYFNNNPRGEMDVNIGVSLRQRPVFIMQAATPIGVNSGKMEVSMMLDAARRGSSGERTVFYAPMPFQRKDRPDDQQKIDAKRQAIGARVILNELEADGAQRFQTVELHAPQEVGFTDLPYDALYASRVLVPAVREEILNPENTTYISPDYGGAERARKYNDFLGGCGFGYIYKRRTADGVEGYGLLGDVRDHNVIIVDDVVSKGSSLIQATKIVQGEGALSASVVVAHGEFVDVPGEKTCLQKLEEAGISRIFVTDTLPQREEIKNNPNVRVVRIAPLIAAAFQAVALGNPIHAITQ